MRLVCGDCWKGFDDEHQWTYCPHDPLGTSPGMYCRKHDLFSCHLCKLEPVEPERKPAMLKQNLRKYAAVIVPLAIALPFIVLIAAGWAGPTRAPLVSSPAPSADALFAQNTQRKYDITRRAYKECRDEKISDSAIIECVRRKTL